MERSLFDYISSLYTTQRPSPSSAPSSTLYISLRRLRARRCPASKSTKLGPPFSENITTAQYCTILTGPLALDTMASQLTLQTKVKLPSGHQIPQLGYGVSAVLLCFVYPPTVAAVVLKPPC